MTVHDFNNLSDEVQLAYVCREGTYLAQRWDDFHRVALLYQMPDPFFVELTYDTEANEVEFYHAFEAGGEDDRLTGCPTTPSSCSCRTGCRKPSSGWQVAPTFANVVRRVPAAALCCFR